MKTKKIILLITALVLLFSLAGCGAKESVPEEPKQEAAQEQPAEQPAKATASSATNTFVGYSDANPESKGEAKIQFTITDGKIADVKIEEIQDPSKGHALKDLSNYPLKEAVEGEAYFREKFTGLSSVEEIDAVDDFAGITSSSAKFKQAAKRALLKAGSEKSGTYFDGTFMGYTDTAAEKGFTTAYVTINNNAIESVILQEWQADEKKPGSFVLKDYATYPLKEAKPGNEYFTKEFVGATSPEDIDAVDDYAGVTNSSAKYKEAVKMALEKVR